jgi:phosphoribosyl 1,2-cyclic phosphate phosphodiesterase
MELFYLGTGAAEGIPALFCDCPICQEARARGGKDIHTRAQALIDGKILIDFGPDSYAHELRYGLSFSAIKVLLFTHTHEDHFIPEDLANIQNGFAYMNDPSPLEIYGGKAAIDELKKEYDQDEGMKGRIALHLLKPFERVEVLGYTIDTLEANHQKETSPLLYAISKEGKTMLYAHDTGILSDQDWAYLQARHLHFSLVSLDCTGALQKADFEKGWWINGHLSLNSAAYVKEKMIALDLADPKTIFVLNHFSHNGHANTEALEEKAKPLGFRVAYDGLKIPF